jgi:uncharacterized membrane protein
MAKKRKKSYKIEIPKKIELKKDDSTIYAFLATILSIIGFVIAIIAKRDDKYVMYYAKHSLVIFIIGCVGGVLSAILSWIPIIGAIISLGIFIVVFLAWILSWIYALSGKQKIIPIITDWAMAFKF